MREEGLGTRLSLKFFKKISVANHLHYSTGLNIQQHLSVLKVSFLIKCWSSNALEGFYYSACIQLVAVEFLPELL